MAARTILQATLLALLAAFYAATAWVALHPQVSRHYRDYYIRRATVDWKVQRSAASLADGIDFTQPAYPRQVDYVLGLARPEPGGRWSDARLWPAVSILLLEPVSGEQCLDLRLGAASSQVGAPVAIRLGEASATLVPPDEAAHDYRLQLRPAKPADRIELESSRPARPVGQDGSIHDLRRLAIMLIRLRLRPGICPS